MKKGLLSYTLSVLKEIAKCKKLLRAAKALYFLFHTITSLFKHADNKDEVLRLHKTVILNTIEKVQPIRNQKNFEIDWLVPLSNVLLD